MVLSVTHELRREWAFFLLPDRFWGFFVAIYDHFSLATDNRGAAMTSKMVAQLLASLGVTKTHSRPRTSNDNPYSESHFKTLKYRPEFPDRFGSLQDAQAFCRTFFTWYNNEHYHTGLGLLTPYQVHYGHAEEVIEKRNQVLAAAYAAYPERFVRKPPTADEPPAEVWINQPTAETIAFRPLTNKPAV